MADIEPTLAQLMDGDKDKTDAPESSVPQPVLVRPTRKRKSVVSYNEDDKDDISESESLQPTPKRARRAKRVVQDSDEDQASEHESTSTSTVKKKARKTKSPSNVTTKPKPKPKKRNVKKDAERDVEDEDAEGSPVSDAATEKPAPKKRQRKSTPKTDPSTSTSTSPKPARRGRPKKAKASSSSVSLTDGRASLDPTQTTMADICADPGVGRPSKRSLTIAEDFANARLRDKERRADALERAVKRMYGEAVDGDAPLVQPRLSLRGTEPDSNNDGDNNADKQDEDEFDYDASVSLEGHHAPQVRIGADGRVMVDEQSLQVDRAEAPEHRMDESQMTHIEENDHNRFVNSHSHSRKPTGRRWTKEETELFFNALQQCGTDFQLIGLLLGTRPRHQIKLKFNREDKLNPERVAWCLKNPISIDLKTLSAKTKRSFDGPVPQYGPSEEQMAQAAARASSVPSSRKATREPSEAPSTASGKGRTKKSRRMSLPEGMEVVSTIEDFVDDEEENEK